MDSTQRKAPNAGNNQGANFNDLTSSDYSTNPSERVLSTHEILANFRQTIVDTIQHAPTSIKADGELKRFSSNGKKGDLSGWYVLHLHGDYAAGAFGCWRTGIKQTWHSGNGSRRLSADEWQAIKAAMQARQAKGKREREAKAWKAHRQAVNLWQAATPASPQHPYLQRKRVGAYGIRQTGDKLLVPVCDLDGVLHGIQTITPDGNKRFLAGTPKRGLFCLIGSHLDDFTGVYLCEGYATGASLHETYGKPVLVAFDAGNLLPVAQAYRARFPHIPLTVCADNDRKTPGNPGLSKAREVCTELPGVGLIVPEFPGSAPLHLSDFNDLCALLRSRA